MKFDISLLSTLQWLREEFLPYLDDWKASVNQRCGFSSAQKQKMLLSRETMDGLTITG